MGIGIDLRFFKMINSFIRHVKDKSNYELSRIKNKKYENSIRKRLTNDNFTIICSNCIGGTIYNRLGKQFLSPTINLWMHQRDFIKFVLDIKEYINPELFMHIRNCI